jgi:hypothetical protein
MDLYYFVVVVSIRHSVFKQGRIIGEPGKINIGDNSIFSASSFVTKERRG